MASAAVEAYMDPKDPDGLKFRCTGSNHTTTQFIGTGSAVTGHLKHILQVSVMKVEGFGRVDV